MKAILDETAITHATISLFVWGVINLGASFLQRSAFESLLLSLRNPSGEIYILVYGGAFIGGLMLLFSLAGALRKHSIAVFLNGASLVVVGVWNLTYIFLAMEALRPYGYTVTRTPFDNLWMLLGLCQLIWGYREIRHVSSLGPRRGTSELERKQARQTLERFVKTPPTPEAGHLEFSVMKKTVPILFLEFGQPYSAQLLPDRAVCIAKNLGDFFVVEKKTTPQWEWKVGNEIRLVDDTGNRRTVQFRGPSLEPSLAAFNTWTSIFSEIDGEPAILASLCVYRSIMQCRFLYLTNLKLIVRTPSRPEQDVNIPLNSITEFKVTKRDHALSISTDQGRYKFSGVSDPERFVTALKEQKQTTVDASSDAQRETSPKYCTHCGHLLAFENIFCQNCGTKR
jgi:hypothetical protein